MSLSWTALLQVASIWEKHTHYLPRGHQEMFDQRSRQVCGLKMQWSTCCPAQTPAADLALTPGRSCHLPCLLPLPPLSRPSSPHHCQVLVGSTKGNRSDEHFFLHLHHRSHNVRSGGVTFLVLYSLLVLLLGAPLLLLELRLGPSLHVHVSPLI